MPANDDVKTERVTLYLSSLHAEKLAMLYSSRRRVDAVQDMIDRSWRLCDEALALLSEHVDVKDIEHATPDQMLKMSAAYGVDVEIIETLSHRLKKIRGNE